MRRVVLQLAESVYNFACPLGDGTLLGWPCYVLAQASAFVADYLDPIPTRSVADRGKPS